MAKRQKAVFAAADDALVSAKEEQGWLVNNEKGAIRSAMRTARNSAQNTFKYLRAAHYCMYWVSQECGRFPADFPITDAERAGIIGDCVSEARVELNRKDLYLAFWGEVLDHLESRIGNLRALTGK